MSVAPDRTTPTPFVKVTSSSRYVGALNLSELESFGVMFEIHGWVQINTMIIIIMNAKKKKRRESKEEPRLWQPHSASKPGQLW